MISVTSIHEHWYMYWLLRKHAISSQVNADAKEYILKSFRPIIAEKGLNTDVC